MIKMRIIKIYKSVLFLSYNLQTPRDNNEMEILVSPNRSRHCWSVSVLWRI